MRPRPLWPLFLRSSQLPQIMSGADSGPLLEASYLPTNTHRVHTLQLLTSDQLCSHIRLPKLDSGMCARPLKWVIRGVVLCGFQEIRVVNPPLLIPGSTPACVHTYTLYLASSCSYIPQSLDIRIVISASSIIDRGSLHACTPACLASIPGPLTFV